MTKIKITNEQYGRLILNEAQSSLNTSNDVLLGLAKIMGVNLSGFNSHKADNIVKDSKKMLELKNIIQNSNKREGLIDDLKTKGMIEPNDKVLYKANDIANNYNKISLENGFDYKINSNGLIDDLLKN